MLWFARFMYVSHGLKRLVFFLVFLLLSRPAVEVSASNGSHAIRYFRNSRHCGFQLPRECSRVSARQQEMRLKNFQLQIARQQPDNAVDLELNEHRGRHPLPPLPDPQNNCEDEIFRTFRRRIPKRVQSWMRDSGIIRTIMDNAIVLFALPGFIRTYPSALADFLQLTALTESKTPAITGTLLRQLSFQSKSNLSNATASGLRHDLHIEVTKTSYGLDERQFVSLISLAPNQTKTNRTIVIVHGGAWGSGFPSMYWLAAIPFLNKGYSSVGILGYRTYPSADLKGQIEDVSKALKHISSLSDNPMSVIGHSSGTHVLTMAFLRGNLEDLQSLDQFVGLAGVYDIPSHYKFERGRGVQRISPMAPVCGCTLNEWRKSSPVRLLCESDRSQQQEMLQKFPKSTILLHGGNDTTVPYSSTLLFAQSSGLEWDLLESVGHSEMVLELMFGGTTQNAIIEWIKKNDCSNKFQDECLSEHVRP